MHSNVVKFLLLANLIGCGEPTYLAWANRVDIYKPEAEIPALSFPAMLLGQMAECPYSGCLSNEPRGIESDILAFQWSIGDVDECRVGYFGAVVRPDADEAVLDAQSGDDGCGSAEELGFVCSTQDGELRIEKGTHEFSDCPLDALEVVLSVVRE